MTTPGQLYKLQQIDIDLQVTQQELEEIEKHLNDNEYLLEAESKFGL